MKKDRREKVKGKWKVTYKTFVSYHWGEHDNAVNMFCACLNLKGDEQKKVRATLLQQD
jgi:hypothetical protein